MGSRQKELEDAITRPKVEVVENNAPEAVRYNVKGENDKDRKRKFAEKDICAVMVKAGRNYIYKIKTKRDGHLFNPLKVSHGYGLDVVDKTTNEPMFKLREVNKNAFQPYIKFLETGYDSYLSVAEREV